MTHLQVAKARDLFYWLGSFYVLAGLGMVAGFSRYNINILHISTWTWMCVKDKKAGCHRPPPPSHICRRLPGRPCLWHQAQQDQVGLAASADKLHFPLSERSRRTFWCTRGIWLICREDFLLWHPLVICPPTLLKLSINSSIQHNTIIIESSLYYHHLISTDAGRLKAAEESKYHAKTHH